MSAGAGHRNADDVRGTSDASYFLITREVFEDVLPLLLNAFPPRARSAYRDLYPIFCAVLYRLKTQCSFVGLPDAFPPWYTVRACCARWAKQDGSGASALRRALEQIRWNGPYEHANKARWDERDLQRLHRKAIELGGVCLTNEVLRRKSNYRFRCREGHEWNGIAHNVLTRGCWCPVCSLENRRHGIAAMRELAESRGGRCLSDVYLREHDKLTWQCGRGHVWRTMAIGVLSGSWCPSCAILDRTFDPKRRRRYEAPRSCERSD